LRKHFLVGIGSPLAFHNSLPTKIRRKIMSYILIPQIVSDSTAMIWVGAIDEKVRTKSIFLEYTEQSFAGNGITETVQLDRSEWRTWKTRHVLDRSTSKNVKIQGIYYQRVTLGARKPLKPRTGYKLKLIVDSQTNNMQERGNFSDPR
jgi:hypothetical protein